MDERQPTSEADYQYGAEALATVFEKHLKGQVVHLATEGERVTLTMGQFEVVFSMQHSPEGDSPGRVLLVVRDVHRL